MNTNTIVVFEQLLNLVYEQHVANIRLDWSIQDKSTHLRYEEDRYFPAPLVGLVLRQMHDLRPDEFAPLHILSRGIGGKPVNDSNAENQFTIWLPIILSNREDILPETPPPEKIYIWDDFGSIYPAGAQEKPIPLPSAEKMIARYVAAMVIGRAVSFSPKEIILDYYSIQARDCWGKLIDRAIFENGGNLMEVYSTEIGCEPSLFHRIDILKTLTVSPSFDVLRMPCRHSMQLINSCPICVEEIETTITPWFEKKFILGIDIGGTTIKIGKFDINVLYNADFSPDIHEVKKQDIGEAHKAKQAEWINQGNSPDDFRWTVDDFVGVLKEKCGCLFGADVIAVGVSLAAPVGKETGRPLATSGALVDYFNMVKSIAKANIIDLHKIDLEAAFRTILSSKTVVKILNDGDADIKDGDESGIILRKDESSNDKFSHEGVMVELKAGTGIAVSVYRDGKPWEISAESAKAIINLLVEPQLYNNNGGQATPVERFQQGVVSEFISKKGIKRLTDYIVFAGKKHDPCFSDPGKFVGRLLDELIISPISTDKRGIHIESDENPFYPPSPETEIIFKNNLARFDAIQECLNELYTRVWQINQLHLAVGNEEAVDGYREALLRQLRAVRPLGDDKFQSVAQHANLEPIKHYQQLNEMQRYVIGAAWVLGLWLADAIALVTEIFDAREVRLAGGPLSKATGIFVAASAERALQDVYGFDIEVAWDARQDGGGKFQPIPIARHRVREMKRLRLVYPPAKSDSSGARGAAKAAFETWVIHVKQDQLLQCRDYVQETLPGEDFTSGSVLEATNSKPNLVFPVLITEDDIADMLAQESAALGLTRTVAGGYSKYRH